MFRGDQEPGWGERGHKDDASVRLEREHIGCLCARLEGGPLWFINKRSEDREKKGKANGAGRTVVHGTSPILKNLSYPLATILCEPEVSLAPVSPDWDSTEKSPLASVGNGEGTS